MSLIFFFFQAEDGIRDGHVTGVQTCALPIYQPTTFDEYLYKSFYEIRYYGQNDVSVMYNMINVLYKIAVVSQPVIKQKVWNFHFYVMEVIEWDKLSKLDRDHIEGAYNNLKSSCEEVRA